MAAQPSCIIQTKRASSTWFKLLTCTIIQIYVSWFLWAISSMSPSTYFKYNVLVGFFGVVGFFYCVLSLLLLLVLCFVVVVFFFSKQCFAFHWKNNTRCSETQLLPRNNDRVNNCRTFLMNVFQANHCLFKGLLFLFM